MKNPEPDGLRSRTRHSGLSGFAIVDGLFEQCLPQALSDAAMDLAIEETLRWEPAVQSAARHATRILSTSLNLPQTISVKTGEFSFTALPEWGGRTSCLPRICFTTDK